MTSTQKTLEKKGKKYGPFIGTASISIGLKEVMKQKNSYETLSRVQKEALDMIATKIARIINGNSYIKDNWIDIAGYAALVVNEIEGIEKCFHSK